ncbi:hypothetical protein QR90_08300 [Deinococcus radiopugnans]|uniref:Helix-turn-helix domain-containing protein n=1 Tax=Deinococcus radiopugnans TaxID=57497 RepID=A0A0A7KG84_9DEIO|nr:hypothetical protein QR90_08300 [Deinococcus radiopugnans]
MPAPLVESAASRLPLLSGVRAPSANELGDAWAVPEGFTVELAVLPATDAGRLLTRRRESLGLRLMDVAEQIGRLSGDKPPSMQYLSAIERGQIKLATSKYFRWLSQILHLSATDIAAVTGVQLERQGVVDVFTAHSADLAREQPFGQRAYTLEADVLVVDHGERGLVPGGRYLIEQDGAVRQARACAAPEGQMLLLLEHLLVPPEAVNVLGRVLFVGQYT